MEVAKDSKEPKKEQETDCATLNTKCLVLYFFPERDKDREREDLSIPPPPTPFTSLFTVFPLLEKSICSSIERNKHMSFHVLKTY
jgi:hypothetical protein